MSRIVLLTIGCCLCNSAERGDAPDCPDVTSSDTSIETAEQLFEQWLAHRPEPEAFTVKCVTRSYDLAFGVERLGMTSLQWHNREHWEVRSEPLKITDAMRSARDKSGAKVRRKQDGTPYQLESIEAESYWLRESDIIVCSHDGEQLTLEIEPASLRSAESVFSWLPNWLPPTEALDWPAFLFFQPKEVQERCVVSSIRPMAASGGSKTVRLTFQPRSATAAGMWKRADVILDTQTWTPLHVRVVNPAESGEEVFSFRSYQPLVDPKTQAGATEPSLEEIPDVAK